MVEPVIAAHGVSVAYGAYRAVHDVDLVVHEGELVGLLGSNGAGKTSLLECLEGLRRPSSGSVRVLGLDPIAERARTRAQTGVMLQEGGFAGHLTVRETVELWRGVTSRARPTDDAMRALFLEDRADVAVTQLSGGERRRLDVVLATMTEPRLLFLDEPTTGLDTQSRRATWEVIEGLRAAGTTIVLTTHYLDEAEALADRLVILHRGRVEAEGTLAQIATGTDATISFLRAEGMRLPDELAARVVADDARVVLRSPDLQRDLARVLAWAHEAGHELERLRAGHPTLDEAFTEIVRRARDAGEGG